MYLELWKFSQLQSTRNVSDLSENTGLSLPSPYFYRHLFNCWWQLIPFSPTQSLSHNFIHLYRELIFIPLHKKPKQKQNNERRRSRWWRTCRVSAIHDCELRKKNKAGTYIFLIVSFCHLIDTTEFPYWRKWGWRRGRWRRRGEWGGRRWRWRFWRELIKFRIFYSLKTRTFSTSNKRKPIRSSWIWMRFCYKPSWHTN